MPEDKELILEELQKKIEECEKLKDEYILNKSIGAATYIDNIKK